MTILRVSAHGVHLAFSSRNGSSALPAVEFSRQQHSVPVPVGADVKTGQFSQRFRRLAALGCSGVRAVSKFISVILADLAMVGFAISFLTLARVELPISFSCFL
jgi:hypothetical protein